MQTQMAGVSARATVRSIILSVTIRTLIALAERLRPRRRRWLEGIFQMEGMGRELWRGEDADDYVRRLRENWE